MAQSTFYPDASPESTSVDGWVMKDGGGTNWSTDYVNASAGTSADDSGNSIRVRNHAYSSEFTIERAFLLFDTSSLPDDATIDSATLSVYVSTVWDEDNDASAYMNVFSASPASDTAIVTGDLDQVGSTKFSSDADLTGMSTAAYLDFTLNASGLANISKTGISKFSIREGHDIDDHAIASNGDDSGIEFESSDNASNKPKLVVNYTEAATDNATFFGSNF